ncbi:MAG TPA: glucose-1-phosphate adenylyltransferase [Bacteroidota bacterium]|nr:glucose-1-phosphate adenylyltransferase [Bacteroidota bacterium]
MNDTLAIILGGGQGTRLYPLTKYRAKPALPLAGKYRLIDITLSNCINSDINKIFVLTQFNSASLNQHINNTYRFSPFSKGFVEVLAAQQTTVSPDWFQGTADAVRKSLPTMDQWQVSDYLILSGDHLYRMDYRLFIEHHRKTDADITISVIPVEEAQASGLGLMKTHDDGRVLAFKEKPQGEELKSMRVDTQSLGLDSQRAERMPYMASMGVYIFKQHVLFNLLNHSREHTDFGRDIIPEAIKKYHVQAYLFQGYWEDIGTIETFYQANLGLIRQPDPAFSFYDIEFPIYTRQRFLPPSKILHCSIEESMICDGCIVRGARLKKSIVGIRSRISEQSVLEETLLMGADYFQSDDDRASNLAAGNPPVGIGAHSVIHRAIIDKNVHIGKNVQIINKNKQINLNREREGYWICNGIVVVLKDAIIPDDSII